MTKIELPENQKWRETTFIPFGKRKKGLLMSDDIRMPSGVGAQSKEIVMNTIHHFNWVQIGGAIKHPEQGKLIDMSHEIKNTIGIENYMRIIPTDGYGNPDLVRQVIAVEKPDFILHFTDPRQWVWLYQMEHEIRQNIPLFFYTIWDDLPFPRYNEDYYESCDWLGAISKQTYNIVKQVRQRMPVEPWQLSWIPHGIDETAIRPLTLSEPGNEWDMKDKDGNVTGSTNDYEQMIKMRAQLFKNVDKDFVVFYNSRNIRRKMPGDIILAFRTFWEGLSVEQRSKVALLMHTHIVDPNGTDLMAVAKSLAPDCNIIFSPNKLDVKSMNYMYNIADVTVNISSNEGWGLSATESLMAGTPIIVNVTGGLQDQCGFKDEDKNYLDPDKHYCAEWGSNHDGKYQKHGQWAFPIFPTSRALVGSPPTPYIFDDRVKWEDLADVFMKVYKIGRDRLKKRGLAGRRYCFKEGFTARKLGERFITNLDTALENWKPKQRFEVFPVTDIKYSNNIPMGISK